MLQQAWAPAFTEGCWAASGEDRGPGRSSCRRVLPAGASDDPAESSSARSHHSTPHLWLTLWHPLWQPALWPVASATPLSGRLAGHSLWHSLWHSLGTPSGNPSRHSLWIILRSLPASTAFDTYIGRSSASALKSAGRSDPSLINRQSLFWIAPYHPPVWGWSAHAC